MARTAMTSKAVRALAPLDIEKEVHFAEPVSKNAKHMSHCKWCDKNIIRVPKRGRGESSAWSHPIFSIKADDLVGWIDTCPTKSIEP